MQTQAPPKPLLEPTSDSPIRHFDTLPGPRGIPILGNALQIDTGRLHLQLEAWCREFGPFFKLRLGKRQMLVVGDHHAVASILRNRPNGLRRTQRLDDIWTELGLIPGLFGANGDTWLRQRRMVMAGFDPAHVKNYFPALQKVSQRLAGRWATAAKKGAEINLQADLMRYTVDTIAGLAFGSEVNTLESDDDVIQQHLNKIFPAVFKRLFAPLPLWRVVRSPADRALQASIVQVNAAVAGFITQARARMQAHPELRQQPANLLEAMIVAADLPGSGMDDGQVAGNVLTLLLAGEDTTANTVAWMIYLLWRNPDALARATTEIRSVVVDPGHPSLDEMAALNYTEACALETMRLKPVAPILPLETLHEMKIGNVRVPKGVVVTSLMRTDSVSDDHLPRAAAFEPERWLETGTAATTASSAKRISMPFGAGPRICPGRYLACWK